MSGTGKNGPGSLAENGAYIEKAAAAAGKTARRENWRLATAMYLADTREQAWADVEQGILREAEYFSAVGLTGAYREYPDQPLSEFTPQSCVDRRDWVVGTPDDAIAWIERYLEQTGGFGGVMLTTHEWTDAPRIRNSMELFARYVMPKFRGHNATFLDDWDRVKRRTAESSSGEMELNITMTKNNLGSG
jgi:limonene 1,2-monooxygenase